MAVGAYFAGVALALCTTCMSALGMALQKMTHKQLSAAREKARVRTASRQRGQEATGGVGQSPGQVSGEEAPAPPPPHTARAPSLRSYKQPKWLAGIGLMLVSSLLSLAVFALVGQAVASSFAAITLVWNALFGRFLLKERLTRLDVVVTCILVAGSVVVVSFGAQRGPDSRQAFLDEETISTYFTSTRTYIFSAVYGTLAFAVALWVALLDTKRRRDAPIPPAQWHATAFGRAFLAGTFSATTGLCSKGFTSLISATGKSGGGGANFGAPAFWLFLAFLPLSLVLQISYLNSALRYFDGTLVVPIYQSLIVILGTTFGFVYWDEAAQLGANVAGFAVGVALIVCGLLLLLLKKGGVGAPEERKDVGGLAALLAAFTSVGLLGVEGRVGTLRKTSSATSLLHPTSTHGTPSAPSTGCEEGVAPTGQAWVGKGAVRDAVSLQRAGLGTAEGGVVASSSCPPPRSAVLPLLRGYGRVAPCAEGARTLPSVTLRVVTLEREGGKQEEGRGCSDVLTVVRVGRGWVGGDTEETWAGGGKGTSTHPTRPPPSPRHSPPTTETTGEGEDPAAPLPPRDAVTVGTARASPPSSTQPVRWHIARLRGLGRWTKAEEGAAPPPSLVVCGRVPPPLSTTPTLTLTLPATTGPASDLARDARTRTVLWALHEGGLRLTGPDALPARAQATLGAWAAQRPFTSTREGEGGEGQYAQLPTSPPPAAPSHVSIRRAASASASLPHAAVGVLPLLLPTSRVHPKRGPGTLLPPRNPDGTTAASPPVARGSLASPTLSEGGEGEEEGARPASPCPPLPPPLDVGIPRASSSSPGTGAHLSPSSTTRNGQGGSVGRAESMRWLLGSVGGRQESGGQQQQQHGRAQVAVVESGGREGGEDGGGEGDPHVQPPPPDLPVPADNMVLGVGVLPSGFSLPVQVDPRAGGAGGGRGGGGGARGHVTPSLVLAVIRATRVTLTGNAAQEGRARGAVQIAVLPAAGGGRL